MLMFIYADCKMCFCSNISLKGIPRVMTSGSFEAVQNLSYELTAERIPVFSLNVPWDVATTGIFSWRILFQPCSHLLRMFSLFSIP